MIEFVIINYNTGKLACECIKSVYSTYGKAVIIVVDNNSTDNSVNEIRSIYPEVKIIKNPENYGYAKAVNIGVLATKSDLVLVSNSDVVFLSESINIAEKMMRDNSLIAVCGFMQEFPDKSPQRSYGLLPGYKLGFLDMTLMSSILNKLHILQRRLGLFPNKIIYPEYADGAALLMKRDVFDTLSGFNEDYFFYTEEADYCKRVKMLSYKIVVNPISKIIHYRGAGRAKGDFNEKAERLLISTKILFLKKHCSKTEKNFFIFAQRTYFRTLFVIEFLLSLILFNINYRAKSKEHLRISKLWTEN